MIYERTSRALHAEAITSSANSGRMLALLRFATLASLAAADTHQFFAVGDWGGQSGYTEFTTTNQLEVAAAMGAHATEVRPDYVLMMGDNFYSKGISCHHDDTPDCVTDSNSHRFNDTFESVYDRERWPALDVPFYVNGGNHDYYGNITAELEYAARQTAAADPSDWPLSATGRWTWPFQSYAEPWYGFESAWTPDGGAGAATVDVIMLDTVRWHGLCTSWYGEACEPRDDATRADAARQRAWLAARLAASAADWVVVSGHYPVFSVAEHGPSDHLVAELLPLLEEFGASLYLAGHDHNAQLLVRNGSTAPAASLAHVVVGAGSPVDDIQYHAPFAPDDSLRFFAGRGSFACVRALLSGVLADEAETQPRVPHPPSLVSQARRALRRDARFAPHRRLRRRRRAVHAAQAPARQPAPRAGGRARFDVVAGVVAGAPARALARRARPLLGQPVLRRRARLWRAPRRAARAARVRRRRGADELAHGRERRRERRRRRRRRGAGVAAEPERGRRRRGTRARSEKRRRAGGARARAPRGGERRGAAAAGAVRERRPQHGRGLRDTTRVFDTVIFGRAPANARVGYR